MSILITGAARRLGAHLALQLAKAGHDIFLHYHTSQKEAEDLKTQIESLGRNAKVLQGDFSSQEGIEQFIQQSPLSEVHTFIHNVGNFHEGCISDTSEMIYRELFETNLHSAFQITKALLPSIKKNQGKILFLGMAGIERAADTFASVYQMTKGALWMMMRSLAKELVEDGVMVNMISPGFLEASVVSAKDPRKTVSYDEIGKTMLFLLNSSSITGQNIEVAKGIRL